MLRIFYIICICILLLHLHFFTSSVSMAAVKLNHEEVETLKEIAKGLGKRDWDFKMDPCSGEGNWSLPILFKGIESSVTCDCSISNGSSSSCHIVSIALKSQNLSGIIPSGFYKLNYLQHLDLSRNNLRGSIPPQWASMRLLDLSLMGNKLSGPFPSVLTKITSLVNLSIEGNLFTGRVPPEIGQLINLQKLVLSSNLFNGELPITLANLINITDMRINDNNFTGKIPNFIGKWRKIEKLHIQGSSLEGPIPSNISLLTALTDLRISDLKGSGSTFPPLQNLVSLKTLILRKCSIFGVIPDYIGDMTKIKTLDLCYNNLIGQIPTTFDKLGKVDFMYLTGNKLSDQIPAWIQSRNKNVDVSNNNFTWKGSDLYECPRGSVNLVESFSSTSKFGNGVNSCLMQSFPCTNRHDKQPYSLHINCGGKEETVRQGITYEADLEVRGTSMYYSGQNWALSSTGNFMDNDLDADVYINTNTSTLNITTNDIELYKTARASPLSLTYYGLCLMNGNYTVMLHFAEIIFSNDRSFLDLGKRMFDVYLQDKLVLKDFDIEEQAGGTGIAIVKNFNVIITNHTLKVHLYWAGKGTTGIPVRGSYGPLISAISVDPNFKPPSDHEKRLGTMVLSGIVLGVVLFVLLILGILRKIGIIGSKISTDKELLGLDLQTGIFSLKQIKTATKNFDPSNKIGEGGFGSVYKGILSDGVVIAVKQLSSKSKQGNREFVTEVGMISGLQHPNLVKLHGCCIDGNQLLLIYEYMENNCVSKVLFGKDSESKIRLDWPTRRKICLGVARGLTYLHEESTLKIVHRDIKTSNILLDKDFNAKISDFGLAKLHEDDCSHISTRIAGTIGYMAPEYAMRGYLTAKADVYSFGVVALEIISGKSNTNYRPKEEFVYLLDWAYVLQERGSLLELVDPELGFEYSAEDEVIAMLNVALLCTNASPTLRPTMSQVVSMIEGKTDVQDLLSEPSFSASNSKLKNVRSHFWQHPIHSQTRSISSDGPSTSSSLSITDGLDDNMILRKVNSE